jgi:hypothetical protein
MNKTRLLTWVLTLVGVCALMAQAQPLAQYTFNDGTARDVSGNGHDGILLGTAAVVSDPERGKVLQVNQSGMQAAGPFAITTSFTLSAWIKLDVPRTGRMYFGGPWQFRTDNQGVTDHHWIEIRYPMGNFLNKLDTRVNGNAQGQLDGQWHHLVLVLPEDGVFRAYFDGVPAPLRDTNAGRIHDFGGAVGPLLFGTETAAGGNAIKGYMDDIRVYNYAVGPDEVVGLQTEAGSPTASNPVPAAGATDVPRDVMLSWTPVESAATRNVYLGTVFDDVNEADAASPLLISQGQDANSVETGSLEYGQTYYWRIDEVNAAPDLTVFKGQVWSFTVEPYAYPIQTVTATAASAQTGMGPENAVNGSGLNADDQHSVAGSQMWLSSGAQPNWIQFEFDQVYKLDEMWVWNSNQLVEPFVGFGAKDVTIEYSRDGEIWTVLEGVSEFAKAAGQATYTPNTTVDFGGVLARYVKLTIASSWGGLPQAGLSEVRFFHVPVQARAPQPASEATDVHPGTMLRWRAGRDAASHDVFLGDDDANLMLAGTVSENSYDTTGAGIQLGQTYYWRVDEVNNAETPAVWPGDVWSFSTPAFLVVDDFESYNDQEGQGTRIYETWIDGWDDPTNGSQVGYGEAPFAERTIKLGGRQSMPLAFDNSGAAYSEAQRTFAPAQDWSRFGIKTLVVNFYAAPDNQGGQLYAKINGKKVAYQNTDAVTPPGWVAWKQWNIDLASLGVNLQKVTSLTIGVEGAGATGMIYVDDIVLYGAAPAVAKVVEWFEAEAGAIRAPMLKYTGDATASGGMYIGTDEELGDATAAPPADGIASYNLTVPAGTYRVSLRVVSTSGSDSLWVRIPGAVTNTANHASGWVQFSGIPQTGADWHWEPVHSATDGNRVVEFTLTAGQHTLEIARREDGTVVDAVAIVKLD